MTTANCGNCKFSFKTAEGCLCRRFPPTIVVLNAKDHRVLFPPMKDTGWCGEHKTKLELNS